MNNKLFFGSGFAIECVACTAKVCCHTDRPPRLIDTALMGRIFDARHQLKRRKDRLTAERVDLAALTARAFDLHSAKNYLRLSGIRQELIESFGARFPNDLRIAEPERVEERRRRTND